MNFVVIVKLRSRLEVDFLNLYITYTYVQTQKYTRNRFNKSYYNISN